MTLCQAFDRSVYGLQEAGNILRRYGRWLGKVAGIGSGEGSGIKFSLYCARINTLHVDIALCFQFISKLGGKSFNTGFADTVSPPVSLMTVVVSGKYDLATSLLFEQW